MVRLPNEARFTGAKLRLTMCKLDAAKFRRVESAMEDDDNWESILPQFDAERSLSDFIAASPHKLEDGLVPYPASAKAREMVFKDHTRLDVLLLDHDQNPVVVECKQGTPRVDDIRQLRGYMRNAGNCVVCTVARASGASWFTAARGTCRRRSGGEDSRKPQVELVQHSVNVAFARST